MGALGAVGAIGAAAVDTPFPSPVADSDIGAGGVEVGAPGAPEAAPFAPASTSMAWVVASAMIGLVQSHLEIGNFRRGFSIEFVGFLTLRAASVVAPVAVRDATSLL